MRALLFNIPDANGLVTEYTYNADGLVTSVVRKDGAKSGNQYSAATLSAFGEDLNHHSPTPTSRSNSFFTGKPAFHRVLQGNEELINEIFE